MDRFRPDRPDEGAGQVKRTIIRTGLETLYLSGMHHLMRPLFGGVGCILTLHHVRPPRPDAFQPNRLLEVTPVFFEGLLRRLKRRRIDLVSLDEMHRRFIAGDFKRRFVCITFDDGYKDVMRWAYPLLKKYEVPFALYIPTSFPDRLGELWWLGARSRDRAEQPDRHDDQRRAALFRMHAASAEKRELYDAIYGYLRSMKSDDEVRRTVRDLCACYKVDMAAFCRELCMDWDELSQMAADPLVHHRRAYREPSDAEEVSDDAAVRAEMEQSRAVLDAALGTAPDTSRLSGRRSDVRRPARIPHRRRARLQDRGDDAAGRAVQGAPRPSDWLCRASRSTASSSSSAISRC